MRERRGRRLLRWARWTALALVVLALGAGGTLWLVAREALGGAVEGARLARAERSPQWRDDAFRNRRPRVDGPAGRAMREFLFGGSPYRRRSAGGSAPSTYAATGPGASRAPRAHDAARADRSPSCAFAPGGAP